MRIVVYRFGMVPDDVVKEIISVMDECFDRLMPHDVSIVDLYLFERTSSLEAYFEGERAELGVVSDLFSGSFFAMHDAWRGLPRITVCLEKLKELDDLVSVGSIRHEVGHSVLHGELQFYLLPPPPSLIEMATRFNFSLEYSRSLLYLISIAVKDCEVTRLLYKLGYVEDQVAYAKFMLETSEDEKLSWRISRGRPLLEALCLVACLKPLGCAAPLLKDEKFGVELKQKIRENLQRLPQDYFEILQKIAEDGFASLGNDTMQNIDRIMGECSLIFNKAFRN